MPIKPSAERWVARVFALVLPVLLVLGAGRALWWARSSADLREDRNAGNVINGRVAKAGVDAVIEEMMSRNEPEVIILGNSLSNTDLLPSLLARRLGIAKNKVQKFSIPNSIGPHWYAVLKNRIFANGHRPRIVILLSDMQSLLAVQPRTEASYVNLSVHLDRQAGEPVLDAKMGRRNWQFGYFLDTVREEREDLRESGLKALRNVVVDLLYWRDFSVDHGVTTRALERVFSDENTDMRLHKSVMPAGGGMQRELVPFDPSELPKPKDSLIPDIVDLVRANEGTVVFLRPPMSPLLPVEAGDLVPTLIEERVYAMVDAREGHYLDMRSFEMTDGHFQNIDHMNPEGARRFTEAVSEVLNQIEPPRTGRWNRRQPGEAELFTVLDFQHSKLTHREVVAEFRAAPPPLGRPGTLVRSRPKVAYYDLPQFASLSDAETLENTRFAARCSPVRVGEDGEMLPMHNVPCEEAFKHGGGRVCHNRDRLFVTATDDTNPSENERRYPIALTDSRWCEGALWVYPGDQVRVHWNEEDLARLERGVRFLRVEAREMGGRGPAPDLELKLRVNAQQVRVDDVFALSLASATYQSWPLMPAVPAAARDVVLEVSNPSERFVLLTSAVLSERNEPAPVVEEIDPADLITDGHEPDKRRRK